MVRSQGHYHLHFTPTSASWLNQVERWFAKITQQRIRRGTFTAVKHLEAAILDYIQTNNRNPKLLLDGSEILQNYNIYK